MRLESGEVMGFVREYLVKTKTGDCDLRGSYSVSDREAGVGGHSDFNGGSVRWCCWGQDSNVHLTRVKNSVVLGWLSCLTGCPDLYFQGCE